MTTLTYQQLLSACSPGGASALSVNTELQPAAGLHAGVAPARFTNRAGAAYAFETRMEVKDGAARPARVVILDSKQSSLNRIEQAISDAIADDCSPLNLTPRIQLTYDGAGRYCCFNLPHRAFDGHVRAGYIDNEPVTRNDAYRRIRDCTPANMRPLLETSPVSIAFGAWDSTRKSHQVRIRSALTGETIGFLADQESDQAPDLRGGARVDPVSASVKLTGKNLQALVDEQAGELSVKNIESIEKDISGAKKGTVSASKLGLGAIPPTLESLGLVSCSRIVRSHVLSFSALRQLRFGFDAIGNAKVRALLAAWMINGLVRSYEELLYRANCDLIEAGPRQTKLDQRHGKFLDIELPSVQEADEMLSQAITAAAALGVIWEGQILEVTGNPTVLSGLSADVDE